MTGAIRKGRQKKRWEDNIKEWTGMELVDSLRAGKGGKGLLQRHLGGLTTAKVKGLRWDCD